MLRSDHGVVVLPSESPDRKGNRQFLYEGTLDKLSDPEQLTKFINATAKLSHSEFKQIVHEIGFRVATWTQRAVVLSKNVDLQRVRALDIYLERAEEAIVQQSAPTLEPSSDAPFSRPEREG